MGKMFMIEAQGPECHPSKPPHTHIHTKALAEQHVLIIHVLERQRQVEPLGLELQVLCETLSQKLRWKVTEEQIKHWLLTSLHAHRHMLTCIHRHGATYEHIHTHKHKENMEETIQFKIKITHTTCESIKPTLSFFSKRQALGISSVWVLRFPGIWILFIKQTCFLTFSPSLASSSLFSGLSSS